MSDLKGDMFSSFFWIDFGSVRWTSLRSGLSLIRPDVCSANNSMIIPPTISTVRLCMTKNWPIEPITAPNSRNIRVNPNVNRRACARGLFR